MKPNTPNETLSPINPTSHLPHLDAVSNLDVENRRRALARWITWYNSHRNVVSARLEQQLTTALNTLEPPRGSEEPAHGIPTYFHERLGGSL